MRFRLGHIPSLASCCYCSGKWSLAQDEQKRYRVLIVGGGLTGTLVGLRLKQLGIRDEIELTLVERATYSGGRFGAGVSFMGSHADLGAQVLSCVDPSDARANPGHGISLSDLRIANDLVHSLSEKGLLVEAPDTALCATEERMLWDGLWKHWWAPNGGFRELLNHIQQMAGIQPLFGIRIDAIERRECNDTISDTDSSCHLLHVKGYKRGPPPFADVMRRFEGDYDCIVFCIPAPNVLTVSGLSDFLSTDATAVLRGVGYDSRTVQAHWFSHELRERLQKLFLIQEGGCRAEIATGGNGLHFFAFQDAKRSQGDFASGTPCAIVTHAAAQHSHSSSPSSQALPTCGPGSVYYELARLLDMTEDELRAHAVGLEPKTIHWDVAQMIRPMEAVVADPPAFPNSWRCIEGSSTAVIVAGDFMTQSSFLGCVSSANAAAAAVTKRFCKWQTEVPLPAGSKGGKQLHIN